MFHRKARFSCNPVSTEISIYNATLLHREELNPHLVILRVKADAELFSFKPGQFAVLGLLGKEPRLPVCGPEEKSIAPDYLIRRAYSIASSSVERQHVEFYLTVVTSGQLTPRLFALEHGSRLFLSPKATGMFTLDRVPPHKSVILIATGTGLAPYMSMLRTLLAQETGRKFVVLHGARHTWDLGYRQELENMARLRPNFIYIPSITRPEHEPNFLGHTGYIQTLLERRVIEDTAGLTLDPKTAEVFLCGNPGMIQKATEFFLAHGFMPDQGKQPGTIHVEKYW